LPVRQPAGRLSQAQDDGGVGSKELGAWRSGQQGEGLAEIYIFYFFSASLLLLANSERISYDTTTTGNSTNPNESHKAALPHILGGLESA